MKQSTIKYGTRGIPRNVELLKAAMIENHEQQLFKCILT